MKTVKIKWDNECTALTAQGRCLINNTLSTRTADMIPSIWQYTNFTYNVSQLIAAFLFSSFRNSSRRRESISVNLLAIFMLKVVSSLPQKRQLNQIFVSCPCLPSFPSPLLLTSLCLQSNPIPFERSVLFSHSGHSLLHIYVIFLFSPVYLITPFSCSYKKCDCSSLLPNSTHHLMLWFNCRSNFSFTLPGHPIWV